MNGIKSLEFTWYPMKMEASFVIYKMGVINLICEVFYVKETLHKKIIKSQETPEGIKKLRFMSNLAVNIFKWYFSLFGFWRIGQTMQKMHDDLEHLI